MCIKEKEYVEAKKEIRCSPDLLIGSDKNCFTGTMYQQIPCASMALTTFSNPAMFAPAT